MELLTKSCTRCKEIKPLDAVNFPLHNKTKSGFDSWCRSCRATYRSENCRGKYRAVISDASLKYIKTSVLHCVICGTEGKLVVDHDHATGKVRGMLCKCGGEFEHTLNTKNIALPHLHVCNKCSAAEDTAVIYPNPVWNEVV